MNYEELKQKDRVWQVYDGEQFKFHFTDKGQAIQVAKDLQGQYIAQPIWNDDLQVMTYINVERVELDPIEQTPMNPVLERQLRMKIDSLMKRDDDD